MTRAMMLAAALAAPAAAEAQTAVPAAVPSWRVNPQASSISFRSSYAGTQVTGRFQRWSAVITFDPARPAVGRVVVEVELASAATGDRSVDPQLPGQDWFNAAAGPRARFQSTSIVGAGPGRYVAKGVLSLRGASVPVTLPFTLQVRGATAVMTGTAQLDRRAFKLGLASDSSAQWVPFAVPLDVKVTATRG